MIKKIHDFGYKKLFSNTTIFQQLLETFVDDDFVKYIDFNDLETVDKSFISEQYKETESDLIYKTKIKGQEAYIYVLLEFQSSVDKFMPLRIVNYITNFYMGILDNYEKKKKTKPERLPAVFPIMIYNGDKEWDKSNDINDLIENNDLLGDYAIKFKYFKIIEKDYSKDELLNIQNIVSTIFFTESHYNIDELNTQISNLIDSQEDPKAIKTFLNWLRMLSKNDIIKKDAYDEFENIYHNKQKVKNMFATAYQKEKDRLENIGIQKGRSEGEFIGIQKGRSEGEVSGKISLLIRILNKKFGKIPKKLEDKISKIKEINIIDNIIDNIFDIQSVKDVENIIKQSENKT
ncbi:MAG: Rpn family recombination-promoting nuclease/putative transposase [Candidatus Sericytochromatia bacterium]|nr:Rpn family recombination-promoting nuclease/putative transposase [Candidatus Sericytochromatia bacterium]